MNKFAKLFCGAALLSLMAACSSDEPAVPGNKTDDGSFYTTLTLQTSKISRSATLPGDDEENPIPDDTNSDAGFEVGQDDENNVSSIIVVLAKNTGSQAEPVWQYITHSEADAVPQGDGTGDHQYHKVYKVTFQNAAVLENAGSLVYVFAYCNPTQALKDNIATLFPSGIGEITNGTTDPIWTANRFLMTNRDLSTVTLPSTDQFENTYNTPENPFNLGTVHVQRVSCRFDFKQTTVEGQTEANVYPIKEIASGRVVANVRLTDLALVNLAKQYYYLPWINYGAEGVMQGAELCSRETLGSWVVSPNYDGFKVGEDYTQATLSKYFFFSSGSQEGSDVYNPALASAEDADANNKLVWTSFTSLTREDNDENWGPDKKGIKDYHIWRYASENTLPSVESQKHAFTTGVVFKGGLEAADKDSELGQAMAAGNPVYLLDGTLYGDKAMIEKYIEAHPTSTVADNWKAAAVEGNVDENGDLKSPGDSEFTIYRADDNGVYPIYYFYWNRHNDNGDGTHMEKMEFATVRDNVYKLAVTNIKRYGKPTDDPGKDDESPETYFTVDVHVLPWVVRLNNIDL